jgi:hypothetical protein
MLVSQKLSACWYTVMAACMAPAHVPATPHRQHVCKHHTILCLLREACQLQHGQRLSCTCCAGVTATVDASPAALLAISSGSVSIAGSSFADLDGGAGGSVLSVSGGASVALEDTTVSGCSAAGQGSAVVAVSGATLSVSGSTFDGNFADYAGGAIGATNSRLTIAASRSALHAGGADRAIHLCLQDSHMHVGHMQSGFRGEVSSAEHRTYPQRAALSL